MVTDALDLGVITPAALVAAFLLHARRAEGHLVATPLLVLMTFLLPMIVAQTVVQLRAGLSFTAAEIVGPIGGFVVLPTLGLVSSPPCCEQRGRCPSGRPRFIRHRWTTGNYGIECEYPTASPMRFHRRVRLAAPLTLRSTGPSALVVSRPDALVGSRCRCRRRW
jgi:hypothetical protein